MDDADPRSKYRSLPTPVNVADTIGEVDTDLAEVETAAADYNEGANPYLRITGWKQGT